MFEALQEINARPEPFEVYTAEELWNDAYTSERMLEFHLNDAVDLSSRNKAFIEKSVAWIVDHFHVGEGTRIADFGCGPGLYTNRFAETGADVTGIDFSERSIRHAKDAAEKKGLKADHIRQNYLEFETDRRFDLIVMIFCDFCALSPPQRKILLDKFHRFLEPGGAVLLDAHTLNLFNDRAETAAYKHNQLDGFWSPDDYYGFLNVFKYEEEKVTLDKYTIIEKNRKRVIYNWLQYFDRDSLKKEFETVGFQVEAFFSDVAGTPFSEQSPDMAVVARKPAGS